MADDRDENFLLLEMELITAQLSAIAVSLQGIDSTLRSESLDAQHKSY